MVRGQVGQGGQLVLSVVTLVGRFVAEHVANLYPNMVDHGAKDDRSNVLRVNVNLAKVS